MCVERVFVCVCVIQLSLCEGIFMQKIIIYRRTGCRKHTVARIQDVHRIGRVLGNVYYIHVRIIVLVFSEAFCDEVKTGSGKFLFGVESLKYGARSNTSCCCESEYPPLLSNLVLLSLGGMIIFRMNCYYSMSFSFACCGISWWLDASHPAVGNCILMRMNSEVSFDSWNAFRFAQAINRRWWQINSYRLLVITHAHRKHKWNGVHHFERLWMVIVLNPVLICLLDRKKNGIFILLRCVFPRENKSNWTCR